MSIIIFYEISVLVCEAYASVRLDSYALQYLDKTPLFLIPCLKTSVKH